MTTAALDLALALHRAPGQRERLRAMRLPEGVGMVIGLAAGSQPLLRDTAARLGETEAPVRDACRFYVEQILLEPGTDAYRVLGVERDANVESIRQHFRWLQHWLHPDRADGWESVFATRVNWAWQQLRNDRARHAWDAAHPVETLPPMPEATIAPTPMHADARWFAIPAPAAALPDRRFNRALLALLIAGSIALLLVLALRRLQPDASPNPAADTIHAARIIAVAAAKGAGGVVAHATAAPTRVAARVAPPQMAPMRVVVAKPVAQRDVPVRSARAAPGVARVRAASARGAAASTKVATPNPAAVVVAQPVAAVADAGIPAQQLVVRVERARQRLQNIVAYFRSRGGHAGAAGNPTVVAKYQLALLLQRNRLASAPRFALRNPFWRANARNASVRADYSVDARRAGAERGVFDLEMAWRGGDWRITHFELEPRR